jgi:Flp pilus assembly CpaE family ATPase
VKQLSFVIFAEQETVASRLSEQVAATGRARVAAVISSREHLEGAIRFHQPDVLFAELGGDPDATLAFIDALPEPHPLLLVSGPEGDSDLLLRAMKQGAREFFPPAPTDDEVGVVIERLLAERERTASEEHFGSLIAVMGANGGVGTTAVSCQLAAALQELGGRVVIVDMDFPLGDVAVHFDVESKHTLADAVTVEQVDSSMALSLLTMHPSGVHVLAAPVQAEESGQIRASHVEQVLSALREEFDWVIVDVAHGWSETSLQALELAQEVLLVTLLDVPTLNHARRHLELLKRLGHPDSRIHPIVNRYSSRESVRESDFVQFLSRAPDARIPNDYSASAHSVTYGKTLAEVAPRSAIHHAYLKLGRLVYGWRELEPPVEEEAVSLAGRVRRIFVRGERPSEPKPREDWRREAREFQVLAVTSNKGGVGKTTVATNLAVYFRALREDLPILVLGFDDQPMADRMFAFHSRLPEDNVASSMRSGTFAPAIRLGQYGVHYVPTSPDVGELKREIRDPFHLEKVLRRSGWKGLVIVDTKSDFDILTRNAIAASDFSVVVVQDHSSLTEAQRVYDLLEGWNRPREQARVLLSLVDRRIKFRGQENQDILALLVSEIRRRGYPLFENFISRSPKIESLYTNPEGHALSILHGADSSLVSRQMRDIAVETLLALDQFGPRPETSEAPEADEVPVENVDGWLWQMPGWLAK